MEKSKVFKQMGRIVGIPAERKTQRGVIARRMLPKLISFEDAQFATGLKQIKPKTKGIKVTNVMTQETFYL